MEKTELERKLECAEFYAKSLEHKIETIEPKAEAYDRLMSGGKKAIEETCKAFKIWLFLRISDYDTLCHT